jgi:hypothetical protein
LARTFLIPFRSTLTIAGLELGEFAVKVGWFAGSRYLSGLEDGLALRLKRYTERHVLALTGADDSLNIGLINLRGAAGHSFFLATIVWIRS